jgi:hypothetical protein
VYIWSNQSINIHWTLFMRQSKTSISGGWWRFSEYEIRQSVICPAPGAILRAYSPWDAYHESKTQQRGQPPYESLLNLMNAIGVDYARPPFTYARELQDVHGRVARFTPRAGICLLPVLVSRPATGDSPALAYPRGYHYPALQEMASLRERWPLRANAEQLIVDWCNEHGLLGILPHTAENVMLAPSWNYLEGGPDPDEALLSEENPRLFPSASVMKYIRLDDRWESHIESAMVGEEPARRAVVEGEPVPVDCRSWPIRATAIIRRIDGELGGEPLPLEQPIEDEWGRFFPGVPTADQEAFQYPRPMTDEFWRLYAEPVEHFIHHALVFQQAVAPLFRSNPLSKVIDASTATAYLRRLLAPVRVSPQLEAGEYQETVRCPSLLSHLAKMASQDLEGNRRDLLRCPCGQDFVTDRSNSRFCSNACGWRILKAESRRLAATKSGNPKKGKSNVKT